MSVDRVEIRAEIYSQIEGELEYARQKWGIEFDARNTLNDWVTYINMYASDAAKIAIPPSEARKKLIKAAGLAISAIENLDFNGQFAPRHYEDRVRKNNQ